jgi:hypothetical protein
LAHQRCDIIYPTESDGKRRKPTSERNRTKPNGYRPGLPPNACPFLSTESTKSIPASASRSFENQKTFQQATLGNFSHFQPLYPKEREVRLFIPRSAFRTPHWYKPLAEPSLGPFLTLQYVKEQLAP